MSEPTQQQRLAIILDLFVKHLPRRRYTRLILTDLLMGFQPGTIQSSNDLTDEQISDLLDTLFPEWRERFINPEDYPQLFELGKEANLLVDDVYPHKPDPVGSPENRQERNRQRSEAYKERRRTKRQAQYEEREAKRQSKKEAERQALADKHLSIPTPHEPTLDNGRLEKLNMWRAKAGLPPVEKLS